MHSDDNVQAYVRVSSHNSADHAESLEIQRRKILDYCKEKNLHLDRVYEDKGISGTIKDRPALLELLKDCEAGRVKKLVVYKQDRLSRELTVALWLETQFKKYDVEVISVADPEYDLEDPLQKAFKHIADIFAELDRDTVVMRLREGRINNAKNGERGSGPVPYGYKKVGDVLIIDAEESKWVDKIFRWKVKGIRYSEILNRLNKAGVTTKRGKRFSAAALTYLLKNNLYCGEMSFGDIKSKSAHPSIISRRLYRKTQKSMVGKNCKNFQVTP